MMFDTVSISRTVLVRIDRNGIWLDSIVETIGFQFYKLKPEVDFGDFARFELEVLELFPKPRRNQTLIFYEIW